MNRVVALTHSELDRQIFLDGDGLIEIGIVGKIRDAEAALTQDTVNLVPQQLVPALECVSMLYLRHL